MSNEMKTPYELGNQNQTTTHAECIAWYEDLARQYPKAVVQTCSSARMTSFAQHA